MCLFCSMSYVYQKMSKPGKSVLTIAGLLQIEWAWDSNNGFLNVFGLITAAFPGTKGNLASKLD